MNEKTLRKYAEGLFGAAVSGASGGASDHVAVIVIAVDPHSRRALALSNCSYDWGVSGKSALKSAEDFGVVELTPAESLSCEEAADEASAEYFRDLSKDQNGAPVEIVANADWRTVCELAEEAVVHLDADEPEEVKDILLMFTCRELETAREAMRARVAAIASELKQCPGCGRDRP